MLVLVVFTVVFAGEAITELIGEKLGLTDALKDDPNGEEIATPWAKFFELLKRKQLGAAKISCGAGTNHTRCYACDAIHHIHLSGW